MALPRLLLAWLVVTLWFLAWQEVRRRLAGGQAARPLAESVGSIVIAALGEALLLVLFAALWFGSLGHGGWLLLFLLVAALVEIPVRLRQHRTPILPWKEVGLGLIRLGVAGALIVWRLG